MLRNLAVRDEGQDKYSSFSVGGLQPGSAVDGMSDAFFAQGGHTACCILWASSRRSCTLMRAMLSASCASRARCR